MQAGTKYQIKKKNLMTFIQTFNLNDNFFLINLTLNLMLSLQKYIKCIIIVRHWMIYMHFQTLISHIGYAFIRYEMTVINIFQAMLHVKLIKRYGTSRKFLIDLFDNVMFIFKLFFIVSLKHQTYKRCICHTSWGLTLAITGKKKSIVTSNNVFMTDQSI